MWRSNWVPGRTRRARVLTTAILVVAVAACSLIVDPKAEQCSGPADCAKFSGAVCQEGFCVSSSSLVDSGQQGRSDAEAGSSGANGGDGGDGGGSGSDGGDAGDGGSVDAGCVPQTSTPAELANDTCTNAECVPFDNCARLGVCDAGLPELVIPPAGGVP